MTRRAKPKQQSQPDACGGAPRTPLVTKLGMKPGQHVVLLAAPDEFESWLAGAPEGVVLRRDLRSQQPIDLAVAFSMTMASLDGHLARLRPRLAPTGAIWCAWPKRASGVATDLTEDLVRQAGFSHKLVDNKVCAITQVWSGLRLVIRVADRTPDTDSHA